MHLSFNWWYWYQHWHTLLWTLHILTSSLHVSIFFCEIFSKSLACCTDGFSLLFSLVFGSWLSWDNVSYNMLILISAGHYVVIIRRENIHYAMCGIHWDSSLINCQPRTNVSYSIAGLGYTTNRGVWDSILTIGPSWTCGLTVHPVGVSLFFPFVLISVR